MVGNFESPKEFHYSCNLLFCWLSFLYSLYLGGFSLKKFCLCSHSYIVQSEYSITAKNLIFHQSHVIYPFINQMKNSHQNYIVQSFPNLKSHSFSSFNHDKSVTYQVSSTKSNYRLRSLHTFNSN